MSEIWFPLYPERFLSSRKVRRMDAQEVGIYFGLLVEQFLEGGALPDDDRELEIAGRAPIEDVRRILESCFTLTANGWENETLENIRSEQAEKHKAASRAGRIGARVRWAKKEQPKPQAPEEENSNRIGSPCDAMHGANGIEIEKESKKEITTSSRYPAEFEEWWQAYPPRAGDRGKKTAYQKYRVARKKTTHTILLEGAKRYRTFCDGEGKTGSTYVAMAQTWLTQERWNEEYQPSRNNGSAPDEPIRRTGLW
jgi:uncharacterized protein YdaU (DUF1376 family)